MPAWTAHRPRVYLLLIAVGLAISLPYLGAHSLWDIDEGYYCEVSREMLLRGDWIEPRFNGQLFAEKPIMIYWLQMLSYSALGVNEFAARLPSLLSALGVILLTYELARRMFDATTALLAAIVLATCVQFSVQAHAATPDMPLMLFTFAALLAFWNGWEKNTSGWLLWFGIFTGLAVLTKGPVGVILPTGIIGLFLIWQRSLARLWNWNLLGGLALLAVVSLPWYVAIHLHTKGLFLDEFLGRHNVDRFVHPMQSHQGSIFFQAVALCIFYAPWCIGLLAAVWYACRECWARWGTDNSELVTVKGTSHAPPIAAYRLLTLWSAVYLIFFSLAATKLPHYVFPLYPTLAILTARFLERWRSKAIAPVHWVAALSLVSLLLVGLFTAAGFGLAGGAIPLTMAKIKALPGLSIWSLLGLIPVFAGIFCLVFYRQQRRTEVLITLCCAALLFVGIFSAGPVMTLDGLKAPRSLAGQLQLDLGQKKIVIGSYEYFQPSLVFYTGGLVERVATEADAAEFLARKEPSCLILPQRVWQAMPPNLKASGTEVAHSFDFYRQQPVIAVCNSAGQLAVAKGSPKLQR